jgi:hypothetical protein
MSNEAVLALRHKSTSQRSAPIHGARPVDARFVSVFVSARAEASPAVGATVGLGVFLDMHPDGWW